MRTTETARDALRLAKNTENGCWITPSQVTMLTADLDLLADVWAGRVLLDDGKVYDRVDGEAGRDAWVNAPASARRALLRSGADCARYVEREWLKAWHEEQDRPKYEEGGVYMVDAVRVRATVELVRQPAVWSDGAFRYCEGGLPIANLADEPNAVRLIPESTRPRDTTKFFSL